MNSKPRMTPSELEEWMDTKNRMGVFAATWQLRAIQAEEELAALRSDVESYMEAVNAEAREVQLADATLELLYSVLGPCVPESVTDRGARCEWQMALDILKARRKAAAYFNGDAE